MQVKISFKNMAHTGALDQRIREKSEKLLKFVEGKFRIEWTCSVHDGKHYAEIGLHGPKMDYFAKAFSDNLYKTLDIAVAKIEKQLQKRKEKWKNNIHRKVPELKILDYQEAWGDYEEQEVGKKAA